MRRRREAGFFQGSERVRLLVLVGVLVVATPLFVRLALRPPPPPPPRPIAQTAPLPPPDDDPVFQGIRDKTPINANDRAAYAKLWRQAYDQTPERLAAISRRDVLFSQIYDDPARFRGVPIHIDGTARRVIAHDDADAKVVPGRRMYEAYIFTPDSQRNPWVVAFRDVPPTLPAGDSLIEHVAVDGYFFKQMVYFGGDDRRYFAPLLIGRLTHITDAPSPVAPPARVPAWLLVTGLALLLYVGIRLTMFFRKQAAPLGTRSRATGPTDEIEPEDLAAWIDKPVGPYPPLDDEV